MYGAYYDVIGVIRGKALVSYRADYVRFFFFFFMSICPFGDEYANRFRFKTTGIKMTRKKNRIYISMRTGWPAATHVYFIILLLSIGTRDREGCDGTRRVRPIAARQRRKRLDGRQERVRVTFRRVARGSCHVVNTDTHHTGDPRWIVVFRAPRLRLSCPPARWWPSLDIAATWCSRRGV